MHLSDTDQNKYFCENKKNWNRYSELKGAELIGEKRGEKIGANKMQFKLIKSLLLQSELSIQKIAEISGLSITMIENIRKKMGAKLAIKRSLGQKSEND